MAFNHWGFPINSDEIKEFNIPLNDVKLDKEMVFANADFILNALSSIKSGVNDKVYQFNIGLLLLKRYEKQMKTINKEKNKATYVGRATNRVAYLGDAATQTSQYIAEAARTAVGQIYAQKRIVEAEANRLVEAEANRLVEAKANRLAAEAKRLEEAKAEAEERLAEARAEANRLAAEARLAAAEAKERLEEAKAEARRLAAEEANRLAEAKAKTIKDAEEIILEEAKLSDVIEKLKTLSPGKYDINDDLINFLENQANSEKELEVLKKAIEVLKILIIKNIDSDIIEKIRTSPWLELVIKLEVKKLHASLYIAHKKWGRHPFLSLCKAMYGAAYVNDLTTTNGFVDLFEQKSKDIESYAVYAYNFDNPLLNHPSISEMLVEAKQLGGTKLIDELIDSGHNLERYTDLKNGIDNDGVENAIAEFYGKTLSLKKDVRPSSGIEGSISNSKEDTRYSESVHYYSSSLAGFRPFIEFIPMFEYLSKEIVYPVVKDYLPDSMENITFPALLHNKPMLFTIHLAAGISSEHDDFVSNTAGSLNYGARLIASNYLNVAKKEASSDNQLSLSDTMKYCAATMLAHTVPSFASCSITKFLMPESKCSVSSHDMMINTGLAGSDCYSVYRIFNPQSQVTITDQVVPYLASGAALLTAVSLMSYKSVILKQAFVAASVVTSTNYLSKVLMDMVPHEMKEEYIDPLLKDCYDAMHDLANDVMGLLSFTNTTEL